MGATKWVSLVVELLALGLWTFYLVVWTRQLVKWQNKLTLERADLYGQRSLFEMQKSCGH